MNQLVILAILCIIFAAVSLWVSQRLRTDSGIPDGDVVYDDAGSWYEVAKPLFNKELMLTGKPDYVVRAEDGSLIPVEFKSAKAPVQPYDGHVMQLIAYCALVESHFGKRPSHGIIRYDNKSFNIDYTPHLEDELLAVLEEMRFDLEDQDVARSHDAWQRCNGCGFKDVCEESLV